LPDRVDIPRECSGYETVHALAGVGEKLMDQRHGVWFTPHIPLHDPFRPIGPRIVQDLARV